MFRFTEIFFDYCRKHSLWGTACRKIWNVIFVLVCNKFYPCRTAGCKKRKFLAFLNPVEEFGTFFHDSKVSTERSIINFIKSHSVKRINNLTHYTLTFGKSIVVAYRYTYRRSNLCNYTDIWISKCLPGLIHMRFNGNCTSRAEYTTLSTVYALCFCNFLIKCRHYHSFCSTECET